MWGTTGRHPAVILKCLGCSLPRATKPILLTTHDSRLTTHDSRLTTHDSRLTTHDSRLTTHTT
ncbi:hypothetical protein FDY98_07955 [Halomonas sp. PA16-9]|nr:hypothetical protein FDY98_07955 [Halomonas sp. PA16-9]